MTQTAPPVAQTQGTVTSKDGTAIAYTREGAGPALILVDGAMCCREMGPMGDLSKVLAPTFTVYTYDRRGRGESGNTLPYAVEREIEDLEALIQAAGGSAHVFGISSGGALALEAANHGLAITKLGLFEAPFIVDDSRDPLPPDYLSRLDDHVAHGRNGEAVKMFLKFVGMPGFMLFVMSLMPMWARMQRLGVTLPYDIRIVESFQQGKPLPPDRWTRVTVPTLVLDGGKSQAWMHNGNKAIADVLPGARYETLPGQTHMVKAEVLAPALVSFFGS